MTWQDFAAVTSGAVSLLVLLATTLGRETVGELKRRVTDLEKKDEIRLREVAQLDERTRGMTASLQRIEEQMVPRSEWEARHTATDNLLNRILASIDARDSAPLLEPGPRRK